MMRIFKSEHAVTLVREFHNAINRSENTTQAIMAASRDNDRINQFINRDRAKSLINNTINKINDDIDVDPPEHLLLVSPGQEEQFISNNELDEIVQMAKNMNREMNRQQDELRNRIRRASNPNNQSAGKKKRKRKTKRKRKAKRRTRRGSGKPGQQKPKSAFKSGQSSVFKKAFHTPEKTTQPKLSTPLSQDALMEAFAKKGLTKKTKTKKKPPNLDFSTIPDAEFEFPRSPLYRNRSPVQIIVPQGSPVTPPTLEDQMSQLNFRTEGGKKRKRKTKRKKRN
tara:strand:- start:77 stop:922 length:846 start_codon:yes stop_codon:yes gene_type:complete